MVASPEPLECLDRVAATTLLDAGFVVICSGGGGIPTVRRPDGTLAGVEAVIDKDLATALLAQELEADLLVIATDVDSIYVNFKQPDQKRLGRTSVSELKSYLDQFPAGSMGPKVQAAIGFVEATGKRAAIGSLANIEKIVAGDAGTNVVPD